MHRQTSCKEMPVSGRQRIRMLHEDCPQLTQQAAKIDPVPHTAGTARNMRLALLASQRQMECLVRQEAQHALQRMRDRQVRREKAATVLQVCLS